MVAAKRPLITLPTIQISTNVSHALPRKSKLALHRDLARDQYDGAA